MYLLLYLPRFIFYHAWFNAQNTINLLLHMQKDEGRTRKDKGRTDGGQAEDKGRIKGGQREAMHIKHIIDKYQQSNNNKKLCNKEQQIIDVLRTVRWSSGRAARGLDHILERRK